MRGTEIAPLRLTSATSNEPVATVSYLTNPEESSLVSFELESHP